MTETVRFWIALSLLALGVIAIGLGIFGVYKFRFVMNRMHCAAIIDTVGLALILSGLMIAGGTMSYIPKLITILVVFWIGSPIASHLVSRMEIDTDADTGAYMRKEGEDGTEGSV